VAALNGVVTYDWAEFLALTKTGEIDDVLWDGPAFRAGVSTGAAVLAVDGRAYSPETMTNALTEAEHTHSPIRLLLKYQGEYRTVAVAYYGGPQYPHLVRLNGTPDYLDEIIAARK